MSVNTTPTPSAQTQATWDCLRQTVSKALERKRRLGHYSVQWKDNAPFIEGDDVPENLCVKQKTDFS
jgi:hypothetical protein